VTGEKVERKDDRRKRWREKVTKEKDGEKR
jgi:hypothetical protein